MFLRQTAQRLQPPKSDSLFSSYGNIKRVKDTPKVAQVSFEMHALKSAREWRVSPPFTDTIIGPELECQENGYAQRIASCG